MDLKTWGDVAEGLVIAVGGGFLGLKHLREKKARKNGLLPNPKRCEDHEKRIQAMEIEDAGSRAWQTSTDKRLDRLQDGVDNINKILMQR